MDVYVKQMNIQWTSNECSCAIWECVYNNRYIYVKIFHINNEDVRAIGRKKEKLRKREGGGRER